MNFQTTIWRSFIGILLLFGLFQSASAELSASRKKQLLEFVDQDSRYDCKYLTSEEREFLQGHFYEGKKITNNPEACDYQLLQVGDEATIERYVQKFATEGWDWHGFPEHSGQARFIEVYAPTMFREEPFVYSEGDTPQPPLSYTITHSIVRLLRESPQLSPEVRHWALTLPDRPLDLPNNRTLLRKWWRENEQHFRERNYQAVKPPTEPTPSRTGDDPSPAANNEPSPPLPPISPSSAPTATAPAEASSFPVFLIACLCAVVLATAVWLAALRGKSPP